MHTVYSSIDINYDLSNS